MKLSLQVNPLKTISENELRSYPMVIASIAAKHGAKRARAMANGLVNKVAKQRAFVRRCLDAELPKLRRYRPVTSVHGEPMEALNFYRITLVRISAGTLDDGHEASALKAVQDEVAAWLGIDDSARSPASWRFGQQKGPPKVYAVRIEIEDDDPDPREVHKILGGIIPRLGPVTGRVEHEPRLLDEKRRSGVLLAQQGGASMVRRAAERAAAKGALPQWDGTTGFGRRRHASRSLAIELVGGKPRLQVPLAFRRSYFVAAEDGDDITLEELTGPLFEALTPPPRIRKNGRVLVRRLDDHPALGEHWIYEAAPSAAPAEHEERRPWTR